VVFGFSCPPLGVVAFAFAFEAVSAIEFVKEHVDEKAVEPKLFRVGYFMGKEAFIVIVEFSYYYYRADSFSSYNIAFAFFHLVGVKD
jgi:hypothetical protein